MEAEGVVFKTGTDVGNGAAFDEIVNEFDAVALCCGAKKARAINAKGADGCKDVRFAVDFLKQATKDLLSGKQNKWTISAKDKHVVVVGGGDTGNDCVGTCIRQGCKSIIQLEMMTRPPRQRTENNPWPEWPKVEKTDYGQQEAIKVFGSDPRIYETTVKELVTQKGKLTQIKTVKVKFEGRNLVEIEGSEQLIKCDLLIIAAGFVGCEDYIAQESKVELTQRGTVKTEPEQYRTSVPKVFTAGDMHRGQSLVVWAITEGRHCAAAMDKFLMGYTPLI